MNYTIQRGARRSNGVTKQVYFCRRSGLPRTIVIAVVKENGVKKVKVVIGSLFCFMKSLTKYLLFLKNIILYCVLHVQ